MHYFHEPAKKADETSDVIELGETSKETSNLVKKVERLENVAKLCGQMMAALTMPGNKEVFSVLPAEYHSLVDHWKKRFDALQA